MGKDALLLACVRCAALHAPNVVVLLIEELSRDIRYFSSKCDQSYDPHSKCRKEVRSYMRTTFARCNTITVEKQAEPLRFVCSFMLVGVLLLSVISCYAPWRKMEEAIVPRTNSPAVLGFGCQSERWGEDFGNWHISAPNPSSSTSSQTPYGEVGLVILSFQFSSLFVHFRFVSWIKQVLK